MLACAQAALLHVVVAGTRQGTWLTNTVPTAGPCLTAAATQCVQEEEVLSECDDLLKKLGMKGSLFGAGDNPMARLQAELEELEKLEQQELEKQQQQSEQQKP